MSTNLTVEARNALQRLTLNASAEAGRRISLSAVLLAALAVAEGHPEEFADALTPGREDEE